MKAADRLPLGKKTFKVPGEALLLLTDIFPALGFKWMGGCDRYHHGERALRTVASDRGIKIERESLRELEGHSGASPAKDSHRGLAPYCPLPHFYHLHPKKVSVHLSMEKGTKSGVTNLGSGSSSATPSFPSLKIRGKMNPSSKRLRGLKGIMPMRNAQQTHHAVTGTKEQSANTLVIRYMNAGYRHSLKFASK